MHMSSHRPATDDERRDLNLLTGALLSGSALAVSAALVPVRDELDNANVAVVLMGLVVLAGVIAGRRPALCVAAVGALAFNFFHTEPFGTLKMANGNDIVLTLLLTGCGLTVGEIAASRTRHAAESAARALDLATLERLTLVAADARLRVTWIRIREELERVLAAQQVWFEPPGAVTVGAALPRLDAGGVHGVRLHRWTGDGFALPEEGVQIPLGADAHLGRIVVRTRPERTVSRGACDFAVAAVALLAFAVDHRPGESGALLDS